MTHSSHAPLSPHRPISFFNLSIYRKLSIYLYLSICLSMSLFVPFSIVLSLPLFSLYFSFMRALLSLSLCVFILFSVGQVSIQVFLEYLLLPSSPHAVEGEKKVSSSSSSSFPSASNNQNQPAGQSATLSPHLLLSSPVLLLLSSVFLSFLSLPSFFVSCFHRETREACDCYA